MPTKIVNGTRVAISEEQYDNLFPAPEEPIPADYRLTKRQVLRALVLNGFGVDAVDTAIANIADDTDRAFALIDWNNAPYYVRSHELFDQLGPALGLSDAEIDAMWMQAKDLPA